MSCLRDRATAHSHKSMQSFDSTCHSFHASGCWACPAAETDAVRHLHDIEDDDQDINIGTTILAEKKTEDRVPSNDGT